MIVMWATVKVHPDKIPAYEACFRKYAPRMRASEPGMVLYEISKSPELPNTYKVLEVYKDEEALSAHISNEILKEWLPELYACIDGEVQIERYDTPA